MVIRQHLGIVLQDRQIVQQQIAEIAGVERAQPLLIGAVEVDHPAAGNVPGILGFQAARRQSLVFPALDHAEHQPRRPALRIDVLCCQQLLDQADLVVGVEDREIALQPDQLGMPAQQTRGHGVEGTKPPALDRRADQGRDPVLHLARRPVGEGDGEDLAGPGAPGRQQMGQSRGQDTGLAGAGPGQHQDRPVQCFGGLALFRVQIVEIGEAARRRRRGARRAGGIRHRRRVVERIGRPG